MNILALDASTDILSVCLSGVGGSVELSLDLGLKHSERLMSLVDLCLKTAGMRPAELDLLACASGPGSFTGLRIGMATVKGLAMGLGKPWIGIPSLDCLAWGREGFSGLVLPVIDGKKGRLYAALYHKGIRQGGWLDIPLAELIPLIDTYPEILVTGPDAELLEGLLAERSGIRLDPYARAGTGRALARLAEERFMSEGPGSDEDGPLYLRPSEAEEAPRP